MTNFKARLILFFFVSVTYSLESVLTSTSAALVSFSDHCASLPPDYSTPEGYAGVHSSIHRHVGFYNTSDGSNNFLGQNSTYGEFQNSVVFRFSSLGEADEQGLFMVQGSLEFPRLATYYLVGNYSSSWKSSDFRSQSVPYGQVLTSFNLSGIWSEASAELCMVGSGSVYSEQGKLLFTPRAALKLFQFKNSTSLTGLITGTLESLASSKSEPNYFRSLSMSLLPAMNYQYTFASNKSHNSCCDASDASPSSLNVGKFCSVIANLILVRHFGLQYPSHCESAKNCSPVSESFWPAGVSLNNIECLEDEQRLRLLLEFSGNGYRQRPFDPITSMIGEGSWDATNNRLFVVACRFLNATDFLNTSYVGDCSTRLSLWFPAMWTIGHVSSIVGKIWTNKTEEESDYFETITFESGQEDVRRFALVDQKYEYINIDKVTKLCQRRNSTADGNNNIYPHPFSLAMRFYTSVENSTGEEIAWGLSVPLSVGSQLYYPWSYTLEDGDEEYPLGSDRPPVIYASNNGSLHNISYRVSIKAIGEVRLPKGFYILNSYEEMVISAEGIYDDTEGMLCMVGCRDLRTNKHKQPTIDSVDCEIVIHFVFPPANFKSSDPSLITGSIESTRNKSDPLYFEMVNLTSSPSYTVEAQRSIWRMDLEIILVLTSNTLACLFGALQLFHAKRHPEVLPSISICMLYIFGMNLMVPLTLNFDAALTPYNSQTLLLGSNGWHEFNTLVVNILAMVGLLFQLRLVKLALDARVAANDSRTGLWAVEKLALFVALPVYLVGSLATLLIANWSKRDYSFDMDLASRYKGYEIFGAVLKTCAGLVMDAFLLPQILLNIFCRSKEHTLAASFYIGITLVQVLPHAYDLYRAHTTGHDQLHESYIYANPAAHFYSTTWNVIVPCGSLLFAVIIFFQQRFGGRCIFPSKLRDFGVYEKVTMVAVAEAS